MTATRCAASVIRSGALGTCYHGAVKGERFCRRHLNAKNDPDPHGTWERMRAERLARRRLAEMAPELLAALRDLREAATDAYKTGRVAAEPFVRAGNVIAKAAE